MVFRCDFCGFAICHTFAINHFWLGIPDKIISNWLGHSTIQITKDVYTKLDRQLPKKRLLYYTIIHISDFDTNF